MSLIRPARRMEVGCIKSWTSGVNRGQLKERWICANMPKCKNRSDSPSQSVKDLYRETLSGKHIVSNGVPILYGMTELCPRSSRIGTPRQFLVMYYTSNKYFLLLVMSVHNSKY